MEALLIDQASAAVKLAPVASVPEQWTKRAELE